jgi:hypothetical protein
LDVGHLVEGGEGGFAVELGGGEEDFADGHGHGGELLSVWFVGFIIAYCAGKIKVFVKIRGIFTIKKERAFRGERLVLG